MEQDGGWEDGQMEKRVDRVDKEGMACLSQADRHVVDRQLEPG